MRNLARSTFVALAVVSCLGMPGIAAAGTSSSGFEDSFAECSYPKPFDLMIMRPLGLLAMTTGFVLFLPYGPIAALTSPDGASEPWGTFVGEPTRFTFGRPLGECSAEAHDL